MFKINRRTDYAVRVMLCLAKREPGARLSTQTVQEDMRIPRPFLQRIIADLSRVGLVNTYAGPNGGLELAQPAGEIRLRQIWEAIEGPILISDCLEGPDACPLEVGCPVNRRWRGLQAMIVRELESIKLDDLAEEASHLPEGISIQTVTQTIFTPFGAK